MMRRFTHAAVLAVALSAPVLTGALMDHSVVSVLGAPGGCSSSCDVGGATGGKGSTSSGGQAEGGHINGAINPMTTGSISGTLATGGPTSPGTGHLVVTAPVTGTASGNFTTLPGNGHCTGALNNGINCK
jgi:hypothetical protein